MAEQLVLEPPFSDLWQGQDAFAAAFAVQGATYRALEQRQTLAFLHAGRRYFIKRHRGARWAEIFKNLLQARLPVVSAHNEWRAITLLRSSGIATPRIVGYGRRGVLPAQLESFLITEDVGLHQSLEDYCRPWGLQAPPFAHKYELLTQVATISRVMHGAGVCHRDYYLCHLLKVEGRPGLTVIDLHRALCKRQLGRRWLIKDLAGLYFSSLEIGLTQRDRLRFIRWYAGGDLRTQLTHNAGFWQAVRQRGARLYQRDRDQRDQDGRSPG